MRTTTLAVFLTSIIVFGAAWYVLYHLVQTAKLSHIESLDAIAGAPASICKSPSANANGVGEGILYVYKNRAILDATTIPWNNQPAHLRVLIDGERNYWLAPESSESIPPGLNPDEQKSYINKIIFSNDWKCSPWWLPDETLFKLLRGDSGMR